MTTANDVIQKYWRESVLPWLQKSDFVVKTDLKQVVPIITPHDLSDQALISLMLIGESETAMNAMKQAIVADSYTAENVGKLIDAFAEVLPIAERLAVLGSKQMLTKEFLDAVRPAHWCYLLSVLIYLAHVLVPK